MHELLKKLQEKPTTKTTLHGVGIALVYFGFLHASEVKEIEMKNVIVKDGSILVTFNHDRKLRNEGFKYEVSSPYYPMLKKYVGQICQKTVDKDMVQFLKNWNIQLKCLVQNMGRNQINLLYGVTCEILGKDASTYTSHTWRRSILYLIFTYVYNKIVECSIFSIRDNILKFIKPSCVNKYFLINNEKDILFGYHSLQKY